MANRIQAIPSGYSAPVPSLTVNGAADAIEFYKKAFGAKETARMPGPDGKIMHADLAIGSGHIMLADENPQMGTKSPKTLGGSPVTICCYVENTDEAFQRAVSAGAKTVRPVQNEFWGDRAGQVKDPFGYNWYLLQHVEDVTPEEMRKRMAAMFEPAKA